MLLLQWNFSKDLYQDNEHEQPQPRKQRCVVYHNICKYFPLILIVIIS